MKQRPWYLVWGALSGALVGYLFWPMFGGALGTPMWLWDVSHAKYIVSG